jgi:hypothetical protein
MSVGGVIESCSSKNVRRWPQDKMWVWINRPRAARIYALERSRAAAFRFSVARNAPFHMSMGAGSSGKVQP